MWRGLRHLTVAASRKATAKGSLRPSSVSSTPPKPAAASGSGSTVGKTPGAQPSPAVAPSTPPVPPSSGASARVPPVAAGASRRWKRGFMLLSLLGGAGAAYYWWDHPDMIDLWEKLGIDEFFSPNSGDGEDETFVPSEDKLVINDDESTAKIRLVESTSVGAADPPKASPPAGAPDAGTSAPVDPVVPPKGMVPLPGDSTEDDYEMARDNELGSDLEEMPSEAPSLELGLDMGQSLPEDEDAAEQQADRTELERKIVSLEAEMKKLKEMKDNRLEVASREIESKWSSQMLLQASKMGDMFGKEREERMARLKAVEAKLDVLDDVLGWYHDFAQRTRLLRDLTGALIALDRSLEQEDAPVSAKLLQPIASRADPVTQKVLSVVQPTLLRRVPSKERVISRFEVLERAGAQAALMDGRLPGPLASIEGDHTIARLQRASLHLKNGRILAAVHEVDALAQSDPTVHELAADWLQLAKERLAAEQAIRMLKAYVSTMARLEED